MIERVGLRVATVGKDHQIDEDFECGWRAGCPEIDLSYFGQPDLQSPVRAPARLPLDTCQELGADSSARRGAERRARRWGRARLRRFGWPLALVLGSGLSGPAFAQTLPQGGTVVGGSGTIQYTNPNLLTINQASDHLAIDWQSFSVGAGQTVRFVQPSSSALALNRVIGADPSQIFGQIQANGRVILLNPNGIHFGPSSHVDVNALIATTAGIRTADFMAGSLRFDQASANADARVVNEGLVSVAQGGFAVLAAAAVQNTGRIVANGGTVVLAGTPTFAVDFHGDGLLNFAATGLVDRAPAGAAALVDNSGTVEAPGGRVLLTARAARDVLDNVINTSGIVVATTAQMVNGEIVIDGGDNGVVNVSGTLDASGRGAGETGGSVKVLGEKVALLADSRIDATGDRGGGTVLVGGNYQGRGPEPNARMVYMDARAVIDASAGAQGDGGRVILWADETTRFDGTILARAGAAGGDGGFVETSGKIVLGVGLLARVDASAPAGANGSWLLDPNNISIVAGGGASTNITGNPSFLSTDDNAQIYDTTINTALDAGNDVTVTTGTGGTNGQAGNITVSGTISNSSGGTRTLTLTAAGAISVTGSIEGTSGNPLSVVLDAPTGAVAIDGTIDPYGGSLTINAGAAVTQTAAVVSSSGTLPLFLNLTGTATANLTNISNNFFQITLNSTSTGAIAITTATTPQLQASSIAGDLTLTSNSGFIQAGALTATGGGTVTIDGGTGNVTLSAANLLSGYFGVYGSEIDVSAAQTVGGSVLLDATRKVRVTADITSVFGGVSIWGNAPGGAPSVSPSAGTAIGVEIKDPVGSGVTIDAGVGSIVIAGAGGDSGTYNANHGVLIDGASLTTGSTGSILIRGRAGASPLGERQVGVFINGDTTLFGNPNSVGTTISSGSGGISIDGTGGVLGSNGSNTGVWIARADLNSTAGISLIGSGGAGSASNSIELAGANVVSVGSGLVEVRALSIVGTGYGLVFRDSYDGVANTVAVGGAAFQGNLNIETDSIQNTTILTLLRQPGAGSIWFLPGLSTTDVTFNGTGGGLSIDATTLSAVSGFSEIRAGNKFGTGALTVGSAYVAPANADLVLNAGGTLTVGYGLTASGSGSIALESAKNVVVSADVTTAGGDVTVWGNAPGGNANAGASLADTHRGVLVNLGATIDAAGGNIDIAGRGSDDSGGVRFDSGAVFTAGNGTITVKGRAGDGAMGASRIGVTFVDSHARAEHGALSITGTGATAGAGGYNSGILFYNSTIEATGNADMTMTGAGGVDVTSESIYVAGSEVRSAGTGTIALIGHAPIGGGFGIAFVAGGVPNAVLIGGATFQGDVSLRTDSLSNTATSLSIVRQVGGGTASFRTDSDATTIGVAGGPGGLQVGLDLLGSVAGFERVKIGSATQAGAIETGPLTMGRALQLQSTGPIQAAALTMGSYGLEISNGGPFSQTGALTSSGPVTFSGTGDVYATYASNAFGAVAIAANGIANVSVLTTTPLAVGSVAMGSGTLSVSANGISQTAPFATNGPAVFDGGVGGIALTAPGNALAGPVRFTTIGAGDVDFVNSVGIALDTTATNVGGNFAVEAGGAITQGGALAVSGNATFNTSAGAITLTDPGNSVLGSVSFTSIGTVSWRESGAVLLGASSAGVLDIVSGGMITQSGPLSVGSATFSAGSNAIMLNDSGNVFSSAVSATATGSADVNIAASGSVDLATSSVGGNLTVSKSGGGNLTQSGALTVAGNLSVNGGAGRIVLNNAGNSIGGTVSLDSTGAGVNSFRNAGAVTLGAVAVTGDLDVTGAGTIAQSSPIETGGSAAFSTGAFAITLNDPGNSVGGSVALTNTGGASVSWREAGAVSLAASNVGEFSLQSGGSVTQAGALVVAGNALVATSNGDIVLSNIDNSVSGYVTLNGGTGGYVVWTEAGPVQIGGVMSAGGLSVLAAGPITQIGQISALGVSSFSTGASEIMLSIATNSFAGGIEVSNSGANAVDIRAAAALNVVSAAVGSGGLNLESSGALTQTGAIVQLGAGPVSLAGSSVTMNAAGNVLSGAVAINATAGGAALTNAGPLQLGAVTVNGNLAVTAIGDVTQAASPVVVVPGYGSTIAATGGSITLMNAANDFGGTLALSGTGGTIAGNVAGAAATAGVTVLTGTFSINGVTVAATPATSASTTATAAVLNEVANVAPIDRVLRVDAPPVVGSGFTAPAIGLALNIGPADLGTGPAGFSGTVSDTSAGGPDEGTSLLFSSPVAVAGPAAGITPSAEASPSTGGPATPQVVLSGATPPIGTAVPAGSRTVRVTPGTPVGGPVTLIQGVLVQSGITGAAPSPAGTSSVSQPFPQQGNSTLW